MPSLYVLLLSICLLNMASCQMHWEKLFDSLSYKLNIKPAPRRDAAIGHDRERNRVVVFGGWQTSSESAKSFAMPVLFDDTWEFDLKTSKLTSFLFSVVRRVSLTVFVLI